MKNISCCFTGYRPEKFNFKIESGSPEDMNFRKNLATAIGEAIDDGYENFYTGMAYGFDILAAETVLKFKRNGANIKLIGVLPFLGQEKCWKQSWRNRYYDILADADDYIYLGREYNISLYNKRNRFMVDKSTRIITYFDGKSGGTKNTINYALKKGREIVNIKEY